LTLAFVFPGQGSQSVGMQAGLAEEYSVVRDTWKEAGDSLGFDLWALVSDGPAEQLNETVNTQPAMLTAGVAAWRAWLSCAGETPAMMAGHSLGEYSALVAAGVLTLGDALKLVRQRAELMQSAVPAGEGAMAAILGLDDDAVIEACRSASDRGVAEAVNFNSPGQVVVAGERAAIEKLTEVAKAAGAKRAMVLPVSVPAHSSLMRTAGEELATSIAVASFAEPAVPVISAVDGTPYADADDIRERMKAQVYSPVRWVETISYMSANGVTSIIECGPGKVLAGLTRRIDRNLSAVCLESPDALTAAIKGAG
jgi:[acyl-carrier-protein] S-malonyltransferase